MNPHTLLLEIAKTDLEASRILLSSKHHPQAIFLFEQSVEKGVKSIGLWMNVVTEEECKDMKIIGHQAWRIFNHIMETVPEKLKKGFEGIITDFQIILREHFHLKQKESLTITEEPLKKMIKTLEKEAKKSQVLVYDLTRKDIDELKKLAFCEEELKKLHDTMNMYKNQINRMIEELPHKLQKLMDEKYKKIGAFSRLIDQLSKIMSIPFTDIEVLAKEIATESLTFILTFGYYTTCLFVLSIITCPHTTDSRYPNSEKNWNPLEKYTESMPLIKMLPFFINEVKEALNYLSELYSEIPSWTLP